ncbi:MAG: DUF2461 domain-containing protein [Flavobacteriaceae bacterium]
MMPALNPDIFSFFSELENNNTREWFEPQKARFKALEGEMKQFASVLASAMNEHDSIDKFKLFRLYRDVRFSKDKTPFKTHFGISFHREKPALRGGYYLHIKPGDNFIATGFWNPEKDDLKRIRKEMELDADEFRELMAQPSFKSVWGTLEGEEVKTAPKGFSKEDPNIDLIRKKAYLFTKKYSDKEVLAKDFLQKVNADFKAVRPFFDYMSSVLTTDLNGVSLL